MKLRTEMKAVYSYFVKEKKNKVKSCIFKRLEKQISFKTEQGKAIEHQQT